MRYGRLPSAAHSVARVCAENKHFRPRAGPVQSGGRGPPRCRRVVVVSVSFGPGTGLGVGRSAIGAGRNWRALEWQPALGTLWGNAV